MAASKVCQVPSSVTTDIDPSAFDSPALQMRLAFTRTGFAMCVKSDMTHLQADHVKVVQNPVLLAVNAVPQQARVLAVDDLVARPGPVRRRGILPAAVAHG